MNSLDEIRAYLKTKTLLVSLITKDVQSYIQSVLQNVERYTSLFKNYQCIIVDGYSKDGTWEELQQWCNKDSRVRNAFRQPSQGLPRPLSLAEARNFYLTYYESKFNPDTYLLILDTDEVNSKPIDLDNFLSCWKHKDWDMMGANQSRVYYDIWALRNAECPRDCWDMVRETGNQNKYINEMQIPKSSYHPLIECDSCFGGAGIYKTESLSSARYYSFYPLGTSVPFHGVQMYQQKTNDGVILTFFGGKEVCEHVPFHQQLKEKKCRLFINPRWIIGEGR
jgi:glycosyltransferase involved in cell wall biosynthesis